MIAASLFRLRRRRAFTLLELMLVITLVAALTLLTFKSYAIFVKKAESVACLKKLKNFGTALGTYVLDRGEWPQEDILNGPNGQPPKEEKLWDWWYKELSGGGKKGEGYGMGKDDWFCPAELRIKKKQQSAGAGKEEDDDEELGFKPDIKDPSYIPAKFGAGRWAPYEFANQPWVIERADFHGDGMNKLMQDGRVQKEFSFDAIKKARGSSGGGK